MSQLSLANSNQPTAENNRFLALDAIRGFALLGILFVNMTWFTGFAVLSTEQKKALGNERMDEVVYWLIEVLVAGKFWTIFAFLFGVGVAIQFGKPNREAHSAIQPYVRRIAILFLIGLAHGIFLWFGDIVSLYAVSGFVLILFASSSDRTKLSWGAVLLLLPIPQLAIWLIVCQASGFVGADDPGHGPSEFLPAFASGSYPEVLAANWEFLKERWFIAVYDGRFLKLSGLFLIGWWFGKHRVLWSAPQYRNLLWGIVVSALLIGLPANILAISWFPEVPLRPPSVEGLLVETLKTIGIPTLGLGYVAALAIWMSFRPNSLIAQMLAVAGRLSLTNYVMQSLIGIIIFYGYGFGRWGGLGIAWSVPLILTIFSFQILFSWLWLRLFKFGPLEWAWRSMSHAQMMPILNQLPARPSNLTQEANE